MLRTLVALARAPILLSFKPYISVFVDSHTHAEHVPRLAASRVV